MLPGFEPRRRHGRIETADSQAARPTKAAILMRKPRLWSLVPLDAFGFECDLPNSDFEEDRGGRPLSVDPTHLGGCSIIVGLASIGDCQAYS